ncbi:hypothetical protein EDD85DRAFT_793910 [Armillaria nabsnona]|nr:hypothetical protein EDD85DRAFT_793910 [Armillaria nabsnona]
MPTVLQYVEAVAIATAPAFYVPGQLATLFFTTDRSKTWRAVCIHALFRFVVGQTAYIKLISAPTFDTYTKWTKKIRLSPSIEDLPDGAKILWIGGAYLFGWGPSFMQFFRYLQLELEKHDIHVDIAILAYRRHIPQTSSSPATPQVETLSSKSSLTFSTLVQYPYISEIKIPLLGALLISPWVCLAGDESFSINDPYNLISARTYRSWGNTVLQQADKQFLDPVQLDTPKNWFSGIQEYLGKDLVISGAKECMYTAHERLVEDRPKTTHLDVEFVVNDGAKRVHDDMLFDFVIPGEKTEDLSPTTALIVDWCAGIFG